MYTAPASMSTLEALSQMARDHKSSMGVTDPASGNLIGNLSVSDLRCGHVASDAVWRVCSCP